MKFFAILAALAFATTASANLCDSSGNCPGINDKRSVGLTARARDWVRARQVEFAENFPREAESVAAQLGVANVARNDDEDKKQKEEEE